MKMGFSRCFGCNELQPEEMYYPHTWCRFCLRKQLIAAWGKLDKIKDLYHQRCAATVDNYTGGEEMFLADLNMILEGEDE